ncbi:MAG: hypothetical protein HYU36_05175 [Planctomycetes bacterium]|nr:hypothetical protein [Planctomycetota bacterium]
MTRLSLAFLAAGVALLLNQTAMTARAEDADAGPRPGKYLIHSYGAPPSRLFLGYFILEKDGTYRAFLPGDKETGKGHYEYQAEKKLVVWKDGPYEKVWGGDFTIEREGKTHKIRLKRGTVATNSTD